MVRRGLVLSSALHLGQLVLDLRVLRVCERHDLVGGGQFGPLILLRQVQGRDRRTLSFASVATGSLVQHLLEH